TGTLTEGAPAVTAIETASAWHDNDVLALAAAAENVSEHPLAAAIVRAAAERGIRVPQATDFSSSPAVGVTATVDGHEIRVGGPRML
ncbi:MAG TPA: heavy metal translocating P-type ATPase, partial [Microbacterium sp.]|nr:heavy metal translocating P-type ATPase [Microbacterium sp.]